MAGQIDTYRQEIFNFLRTLTIKFEPFAYMMGETYMEENGLTDPHAAWNPYYINISGKYSESDTPMVVKSLETGELVPFDEDLVTDYPVTAAVYRIPHQEFFTLQEKYPRQAGLIQHIVYPASSIEAALAAPNLSILAYDTTMLETQEREDLLQCLTDFLDEVRTRWWRDEFCYEDMYAVTFWSMLWQLLPVVLLTRRVYNIRTPYVHTFHIWEYLKSHGLGDYRDVLTTKQSLWLYRNLGYVLKNQGKNSTLKILAKNLLPDVAVSLLYRLMYQETETRKDQLITNPRFRAYEVLTDQWVKTEDFATLNTQLHQLGYEKENSPEFIDKKEVELATQPNNILPTKFLEFKKEIVDTTFLRLMVSFLIESFIYRCSINQIGVTYKFRNPLTDSYVELMPIEILALLNFACFRSVEQKPTDFPALGALNYPLHTSWAKMDIKESFVYDGHTFLTKQFVDLNAVKKLVDIPYAPIDNAPDQLRFFMKNFRGFLNLVQSSEASSSLLFHLAMANVFDGISVKHAVPLDFSRLGANYAEWFAERGDIAQIVDSYESYSDKERVEAYRDLANFCYDTMFPFADLQPEEALYSTASMEKIYTAIRDLFVSLCSYNVTYLETDRSEYFYVFHEDPDVARPSKIDVKFKDFFLIPLERVEVPMKTNIDLGFLKEIEHEFSVLVTNVVADLNLDIELDTAALPHDANYNNDIQVIEHIETNPKGLTYHLTLDVDPCVL